MKSKCIEEMDLYIMSIEALKEYIKKEKNVTEKKWNRYAAENNYLSSKTLIYIHFSKKCEDRTFSALCMEIK